MKDIIIIANFSRDFSPDDNGRFMYLCKELSKKNRVEIITSNFKHSDKKHLSELKYEWPFKITLIDEPGYKKNISIRRFFSHFMWGKKVNDYLNKRTKPDVVYSAIPSLTAPYYTAKYCDKNKVRFIIDIQDLWPEAFKMIFNAPLITNILFWPLNLIANAVYKRADEVIAVSNTYVERALNVNSKCQSGHVVYLGTNLETYDNNVSTHRNKFYKFDNEIWIGYCGSLSASYDITTLIKSIELLKNKGYKNVKLIIMGEGSYKNIFEKMAQQCQINHVFTGYLPYPEMCGMLSLCDIVVNPIKGGSAASIINKHGDYAASGRPVINSQDSLEYRNLIEEYKMGINCDNESFKDMANKLELLLINEDLRISMGKNARKCAVERFDRKNTYKTIEKCILK